MDPLDKAHDFNTADAKLLARLPGRYFGIDPRETWAFYEHPRHGAGFPIVAVEETTGEKYNTGHYDIEEYTHTP
jgi:hypothetical protein